MLLHSQAREILRRAYQRVVGHAPSEHALDLVQAVAWGETLYGRGGQFAAAAARGQYNWGALEKGKPDASGSCGPNAFPGKDHDAQGNLVDVCFLSFATDEDAATRFLGILLQHRNDPQRRVLAAVEDPNGTPEDMAAAMKAFGYFVAPVEKYAAMIRNNSSVGRGSGGIDDSGKPFGKVPPPNPYPAPGGPSGVDPSGIAGSGGSTLLFLAGLGGAGAVGWYLYHRWFG